jgi:hypothetical protein
MIKKIVKTRFVDEEGFEFTFEPVENSLTITKKRKGYEARYLVQDDNAEAPENDDNAFLVHYHRSFEVSRDSIITKNDLANWYRKEFTDYDDGEGNLSENIPQAEQYWIFPVTAYIHSGVALYLGKVVHPFDQAGWDTSHVGAVLIGKDEWSDENKAYEYAEGIIKDWNAYLSGDVYGIVKETYDKGKNQVDQDSCWGFFEYKYAIEELKSI